MRLAICGGLALVLVSTGALAAKGTGGPMRVAVMEFTNAAQGADLDSLGKGLQSMMTTDLAQVQSFKLVERQRLQDVQAELKLARSSDVDKNTAAKIGKLAGATHLVSGSFTVIGEKMRIDCRMFTVENGDIMMAEKMEGEKSAFFELEKDLVKKIIDANGTKLAPKERADVGRIHTADFEAFRKFSQGVAAFDDKKYDQAVAALKEAESRDKDFKLAHVTLGEYEEIITKLRSQATDILTAEDQLERLKKQKARSVQAEIAQRLLAIAAKKGPASQLERLTALHTLILGYSKGSGSRAQWYEIEEFEDRFLLDRTADSMTKSYWNEAWPLWPKLPVLPAKEFWHTPTTVAGFDKDFKEAVDTLAKRGADYPINRKNYLLENVRGGIHDFARRLQLDAHEEAKLRQKLYEMGLKLGAEDYWRHEQIELLAKYYRDILDLDRSTQLFTQMSSGEKNAWRLKGLASEIETNKRIATLLAQAPADKKRLLQEFLGAGDLGWRLGFAEKKFFKPELFTKVLYEVGRTRGISGGMDTNKYVIVGNHPIWALQSAYYLGTGARTDVLRASELYYFHLNNPNSSSKEKYDSFVIADGVPRKDLTAHFNISYTPGKDFWPSHELGASDTANTSTITTLIGNNRPVPVFLFGIRDIRCDKQKDEGGKHTLNRPMHAWGLVFQQDRVQLVEVTETVREGFDQKRLEYKVKEEQKASIGGAKPIDVSVSIDGGNLKVDVGGKTLGFKAPDDRQGFYGYAFRGEGFVQIGALALSGRK